MKKTILKATAQVLLVALIYQFAFPMYAYALTSGPSTPEVQSFEPVGTTDMVDMFTGDFTYNIPLMDVEGFPINISYHGGISIEQEASWVGLGWNINPGEINRSVRGLPDDFNGETIEKTIKINEERDYRVAIGANASAELFGFNPNQYGVDIRVGLGSYVAFNNYKGMSVGVNFGVTISTPVASAGVDMGVGSQSGADIDLNAGLSLSKSITENVGAGIGVSGGTGFNSRSGLKDLSFGAGVNATIKGFKETKEGYKPVSNSIPGQNFGSSIPIGLQNYVPVITNASVQESHQYQVRFGGEAFYAYPNAHLSITSTKLSYEPDGSRAGYGYLYSENATDEDITDFSREKDGYYNNTLKNLPLASMTYDVYSISGQGTGGMFRPFRNDIGTVYDPKVEPEPSKTSSLMIEGGIGNLFEVGTDMTFFENANKSGAWKRLPFRGGSVGNLYETFFFKQAGELTYNNQQNTGSIFNDNPVYLGENEVSLFGKGRSNKGTMPSKYGDSYIYTNSNIDRTARANLLTYITGEEADVDDVALNKKIVRFGDNGLDYWNPTVNEDDRYGTNADEAKAHQITEFSQTLPDGRRYIYGIPAINHVTREVTFNVPPANADLSTGLVSFTDGTENSTNNSHGKEGFYSHTGTPAYAYSYLLTAVLSNDYVDVLGDGPTDDDLGSFTKINYTRKHDDYRWRAPYETNKAQYNPGFWSDDDDDKGTYITGAKQIWHIRSIETKNYIAEFYISEREDGKGISTPILPGTSILDAGDKYSQTSGEDQKSYKLDEIRLYNKNDRYLNEDDAIPIKTVIFKYSYSLCNGVPNGTSGKLTLDRIYIKYGNSEKNLLSPYVFTYGNNNPYVYANKDRWGNYQPSGGTLTSFEYPYVDQENADDYADAWCLTKIKLPSGGEIEVEYEADDYSYVQDKRSMQMFKVEGVGSSPYFEQKATLYESVDNVNDYVYFKRRKEKENPSLSFKDNYLEGTNTLYYSFNLDISGRGKYEHIKGYAEIETMDTCIGSSDYAYIKLKKERSGNSSKLFHPATIYGLNIGRHYLPHVIYRGYSGSNDPIDIMYALIGAFGELLTINQDPIERFVQRDRKAKNIKNNKSWVRLDVPGLTKKGGGTRVKKLKMNDAWSTLTTNTNNANYGKAYDYTVWDSKWNRYVSSGVASYEPMIGGDENPHKVPVPYTASSGRLLPAIKFFQEEPFGESFFPAPVVGYSKVTVKSIHAAIARSAQSEEEHNFYTAKDFPIEIDYTEKDAPNPINTKTLRKKYEEVKAMQGYILKFNDMHGKPKGTNYYVINTDGVNRKRELVSGMTYNYQINNQGKLDNRVNAVVRTRGTTKDYTIEQISLGEEMDFTIDSRERDVKATSRNVDINVNVVLWGFIPIPVPTAFWPSKEEQTIFHSLVSTKIVQKYGVLSSVEIYDHGAKIKTENLLYDSETGGVLLSRTNNEYSGGGGLVYSGTYELKTPAYWAYEGMGPAYTNVGFEELADSLHIERHIDFTSYYGRLFVADKDKYSAGDELLITYAIGGNTYNAKVWIVEGVGGEDKYGTSHWELIDTDTPRYEPYPRYKRSDQSHPYDTIPDAPFRQVVLRALKDQNDNVKWPGGLDEGDKVPSVHVKVLRSGRRNDLNQYVQQTSLTTNPGISSLSDLLGGATAFNKVLNVSAVTFSDDARPFSSDYGDNRLISVGVYDPLIYPNKVDDKDMRELNRYVLGYKGNYRPVSQYVYSANRSYSEDNIRFDGTYSLAGNKFWNYNTGISGKRILEAIGTGNTNWIKTSEVTKYDVFGNAIEEIEVTGKYSSAQYGYNQSLPVAVASNTRQKGFCFDGFEEYDMLVPKHLHRLFFGSYYNLTPFSKFFTTEESGREITRHNQKYIQLDTAINSRIVKKGISHTGNYSITCTEPQTFDIPVREVKPEILNYIQAGYSIFRQWINIKDFSFDKSRKYIVSLWVNPVSEDIGTVLNGTVIRLTDNSAQFHYYPFILKTGNIDGWYKAECVVEIGTDMTVGAIVLNDDVYYDDIRFFAVDAPMKSFVYDPVSFKLTAQLDENNFATFYEYDQEGLLVRVKKETDRGIVTISESRRANQKN